MEIKDFLTEKWMTDYERQAKVNLTDTSAESLSLQELLAFEPEQSDLMLDYGWIDGDPDLRKEILSLYQDQKEETLTLTNGALQGNEMIMSMLLKPGDHVITITPGYQQFSEFPRWLGCAVSEIELEEDWTLDLDKVKEAIGPNTRLIIFDNPSNPTGMVLDQNQLEELIALCRKHDLWLVNDEVYRDLDGSMPSLSDLYEKSAVTGSLSKTMGLAGLRLGWIKGNPALVDQVRTFRDYTIICAGPVSERLAAIALRNKDQILGRYHRILDENHQTVKAWLDQSEHFSCHLATRGPVQFLQLPEGVLSEPFCKQLLTETGIFFVPGASFGREGYVRFGLGKKHDDLMGALQQLEQFTASYIEKNR